MSQAPASVSQEALHTSTAKTFLQELQWRMEAKADPLNLEQVANGVVHPVTQKNHHKYKNLIEDPLLRETWMKAMAKELRRLAQGYKDTKGTNTIEFMDSCEYSEAKNCHVCTHCSGLSPTDKDKNRVRIMAGGNLINYLHELITHAADITTSKCMWNSTMSTHRAWYICSDAKNFYLATPLKDPEYMCTCSSELSVTRIHRDIHITRQNQK